MIVAEVTVTEIVACCENASPIVIEHVPPVMPVTVKTCEGPVPAPGETDAIPLHVSVSVSAPE